MNQLQLLWQLQDVDDKIKNLQEKLQKLDSVLSYNRQKKEVEDLMQKKNSLEETGQQLKKALKKEEMDLQKITADIKETSSKLYGGEVSNVKELEQMEKRVSLLKKEQGKKEDNILAKWETIESEEEKLDELTTIIKKEEQTLKKLKEEAQKEIAQVKSALEQAKIKREEIERDIEGPYLSKYQFLKEKNKGKVVACVVNGICEGCKVSVPSSFRAHLLNGQMTYCENCGRLLALF